MGLFKAEFIRYSLGELTLLKGLIMKYLLKVIIASAVCCPIAYADDAAISQLQSELKTVQQQQQQQLVTLNSQIQAQFQKVQSDLEKEIQTANEQIQSQLKQMQATLHQQIVEVQQQIPKGK